MDQKTRNNQVLIISEKLSCPLEISLSFLSQGYSKSSCYPGLLQPEKKWGSPGLLKGHLLQFFSTFPCSCRWCAFNEHVPRCWKLVEGLCVCGGKKGVCVCDNLCVITLVLAWHLWRRRISSPNLLKVGRCTLLIEKETGRYSEQDLVLWEGCKRCSVSEESAAEER